MRTQNASEDHLRLRILARQGRVRLRDVFFGGLIQGDFALIVVRAASIGGRFTGPAKNNHDFLWESTDGSAQRLTSVSWFKTCPKTP